MTVPAAFTLAGPPPDPDRPAKNGGPDCRTCGAPLTRHTGQLCAICRAPVEHHDQPQPNGTAPLRFDECLAGRIRTAGARQRPGVPLNAIDQAALALEADRAAA